MVDSAYPLQTSGGIETIETGADQVDDRAGGARGYRQIAAMCGRLSSRMPELKAVPESDAAGVTAYRESLSKLLGRIEGGKVERDKRCRTSKSSPSWTRLARRSTSWC